MIPCHGQMSDAGLYHSKNGSEDASDSRNLPPILVPRKRQRIVVPK